MMKGGYKLLNTILASVAVVAFLLTAPTIATAVTTNLNAGDTINLQTVIDNSLSVQIGDKVFGFDSHSWDPNPAELAMAAANVNLKAIVNLNDIGFSLQFQVPWTAGDTDNKDIKFQYTVAVTNSSNLISDLHLSITGTASGDAYANVGETAYSSDFGVGQIGSVQAFVFDGFPEMAESVTNLDSAVTQLWIYKDMNITGASEGLDDSVSITAIDQTFSQIPEPSTMLLVGLGLMGVVAVNRKRQS